MSEEIKDREERFKSNDLWNHGGVALENAHQSAPRDTSIEAMEEWRKEKNYQIEFQQINKILRLARPLVSYIAKYDLYDSEPQPVPEELIKALKDMADYQIKNLLEEFKRCKDALRLTTDQFEKWLLQINEAERQDIYEVLITLEPHTGGSKSSWLRGTQIQRFKKETADKKMITEEAEKYYYDKLIPAFEQELKNRENSEKVNEIITETNKFVKEHKQLAQKVTNALMEFGETQCLKIAKTFIEGREKMRILESEIYSLSHKCDLYETSHEKLPTLANEITSNELQSSKYSAKGALIKKIETFYKKEIELREASKKA